MNEVLTTIKERRSIRAYTSEQLTNEQLFALRDAALMAPTAMNRQLLRFFFITDAQLLSDLEQCILDEMLKNGGDDMRKRLKERKNKILYDAPLLVLIASDVSDKYAGIDSGIAVENIALAAKSMGLESVILGMPGAALCDSTRKDEFKSRIGIPDKLDFCIGIAVGHPAMEKAPHEIDETHCVFVK